MRVASASRSTISAGVCTGAARPNHEDDTTPGSPASAKVGTSGSKGERVGQAMASALSFPARIFSTVVLTSLMNTSTSPLNNPSTAGPPPRYGTWMRSTPASRLNNSLARWMAPPAPDDA